MMPDVPKDRLWNEIPDRMAYPDNEKWYSHLLDQYKLYVEMADRISQRRTTANSYFLSVNSAILAFVGYLTSKDSSDYLWLLAIAGVTLTFLWYSIITSYRNLNSAKWEVVHEIEKRLPISPYDAEWDAVQRGKNAKLYRPISHIEAGVPWVFFVLHLIVLLKTFPWLVAFAGLRRFVC
ncbi:RipA family octameric membrane protein [Burkholderia diffusa]|uniref:RipA family octameric membrane protein n=1 Tax=Burkholderia diffusa TaxID=488732 RepID=UPI000B23F213|nr:hypothetical protein [Burkholderia diffusa]